MERLLERFACLGTNLEVYQSGWTFEGRCPGSSCDEPTIHITRGMSVDQFAVSYVNRKLLTGSQGRPYGGGAAPPAPPAIAVEGTCSPKYTSQSSRPGVPCMPRARKNPFKTDTPWRSELGERVLQAVVGRATEEQCDGFELFGDSTWCNRAMRQPGVLGFSYGIEERDLWSEKMSNVFKMETRPPAGRPPPPLGRDRGGVLGI